MVARHLLFVVLLAALGVAFRIPLISDECLWFDEIFSVYAAAQPWGNFFQFIALDLIHPPLFYLILKGWIAVGGESAVWLRTLPVLFWLAAVFPFLWIARELKLNFNSIAISLFFLIFSGSMFKYSVELRMYSLLLFLGLLSFAVFLNFAKDRASILLLILINSTLIYSHYFGWFVVGGELVVTMIFYWNKIRRTLIATSVNIVVFAPWIVLGYRSAGYGQGLEQNIGWMTRPGIREVLTFLLNLFEPFFFQTTTAQPISIWWLTLPLIAVVAVAAIVSFATKSTKELRPIHILAILFAVPILAAFAISWLSPFSIWGTRHLIIVFAPLFLMSGVVFGSQPNDLWRRTFTGIVFVVFAVAGIAAVTREKPRPAWCEAAAAAGNLGDSSIPLMAVEDMIAYQLWFSERKNVTPRSITKISGIDGISEDKAYFLPRGFDEVKRLDVANLDHPRFWLIIRGKKLAETEPPLRNLVVKDYRIAERRITEVDGEKFGVFLVEK